MSCAKPDEETPQRSSNASDIEIPPTLIKRMVDYHNNTGGHVHESGNLLDLLCLGESCAVCLREFSSRGEEIGMARNCGHIFCFNCIRKWTRISPTCPLCKQSLETVVLKLFDDLCMTVFDTKLRSTRSKATLHPRRKLIYLYGLSPTKTDDIRVKKRRLPPGVIRHPSAAKLREWVTRDIEAVFQTDRSELSVILDGVFNALEQEGTRSSRIEQALASALPITPSHFLEELEFFLGEGKSMFDYDRHVQYQSSRAAGHQQPTNALLLATSLAHLSPTSCSWREASNSRESSVARTREGSRELTNGPYKRIILHYTDGRSRKRSKSAKAIDGNSSDLAPDSRQRSKDSKDVQAQRLQQRLRNYETVLKRLKRTF
eukprot:gb/GECG01011263.1/.p1 GENE.gb/GECG01011263.1/~~gb/GECG01011263.1/.p1  ORF type:complete len:374 (+),score=34.20 gb/GECG01011263.1/:1-1122(+)